MSGAANWTNVGQRITATVRTTNRMNALLTESMLNKRKALIKCAAGSDDEAGQTEELEKPKNEFKYFTRNFSMEKVYKIIALTVEERMIWDRCIRFYDSWRSLQLAESLGAEIRLRLKKLKLQRHRIVCIISIVEKQNQGLSAKMCYFMDEKLDNFTTYTCERPSHLLVATVFLVHKN